MAPDAVAKKEFDAAGKVNVTDNTIELGANHGLKAGDAVVYSKGGGTGIQASIDGITKDLAEGTTYYVILSGTDKVKLASTAANAKAGTAIDLTTAGTGTQSLTLAKAAPVKRWGEPRDRGFRGTQHRQHDSHSARSPTRRSSTAQTTFRSRPCRSVPPP